MNLYLVQHGQAVSEEENPQRPLSDEGRVELQKMIVFLNRNVRLEVKTIFHSGKTRAQQTADLLSECLKPTGGVRQAEGLAPKDDPGIWAAKLDSTVDDVMLTGHLPHLSRLAALLLCGNSLQEVIDFRNAGIVCLHRDIDNQWTIGWIVIPGILS